MPEKKTDLRKTLLILIDTSFIGGPEKYILGYAKHLKQKFNVIIASFERGEKGNQFMEYCSENGFKTCVVPATGAYNLKQIYELARIVRAKKVDFINSHGYRANLISYLCRYIEKIPIIATFHGYTRFDLKISLLEKLDRLMLRKMRHVITVSKKNRDRLIAFGLHQDKISVLPNAIDMDHFFKSYGGNDTVDIRKELKIGDDTVILTAIGRLSPEKGQKVLINAFIKVLEIVPDAVLLLVGEGPDFESLKQLADQSNLSSKVKFLGFRSGIIPILKASTLFVLPSLTEGLPTVVLEAFACLTPVVATCAGGTPEVIIQNQTGVLVSINDHYALKEGILKCLSDPEFRLEIAQNAYQFLAENYTFSAHSQRCIEVFGSLRKGR